MEQPMSAIHSDGLPTRSSALSIYKSLPPLPIEVQTTEEQLPWRPSVVEARKLSYSSSTATLAQASLGIGLPHVIARASTSLSSSEINSIPFVPPVPDTPTSESSAVLRKKSQRKSRAFSTVDSPVIPQSPDRRRRSRGLSLGASGLLGIGGDGKGKDSEGELDGSVTPVKPLSRKTSFWSRKKSLSSAIAPPPDVQDAVVPFVPLPLLVPASPLLFDTPLPHVSPPIDKPRHVRGLSRSHSDRFIRHSSTSGEKRVTRSSFSRPTAEHLNLPPLVLDSNLISESPPGSPGIPYTANSSDPDFREHHHRGSQSQTNSPLLHRLSLHFFSSTPPPPPLINQPANSSSTASANSSRPSLHRVLEIPKPETVESPEAYLERLPTRVNKADIAGILASHSDAFHAQALNAYLTQFKFSADPLDIALRKLLMHAGLPRETQQIDRVMEAFAKHYISCNPGVFSSDDHPYILAFSLIMLHTDAFNKSNKRKMTKQDYIKNTTLPGVRPEVLDYFYDNIVFAPFIFVEDPVSAHGDQSTLDVSSSRVLSPGYLPTTPNSGSGLLKTPKLDPYHLITQNSLRPVGSDSESLVPVNNPYSYSISDAWDVGALHQAFANANVLELNTADTPRPPTAIYNSGQPPSQPNTSSTTTFVETSEGEPWRLKFAKMGTLNRKDDRVDGGKKASNRKWKSWGVILTASQILFFRDPTWIINARALLQSTESTVLPYSMAFKPDELFPLTETVAVYDSSYTKHHHTLRFVSPGGHHILLQASNPEELDEWVSMINYASAFKTLGVRMRPLGMSGKDFELTGVAAATSHLHDLQVPSTPSRIRHWGNESNRDLMDMLSTPRLSREVDFDAPIAPEVDGADQFKATFDQVKADLAAGRLASSSDSESLHSATETTVDISRASSSTVLSRDDESKVFLRSTIIQSKLRDLESQIRVAQTQLDNEMGVVRSITMLTPFQRSTRNRLLSALHGMAHRVQQVRLDVVRLTSIQNVLSRDLDAEGRDWQQAKKIALKAATEALQSQIDSPGKPSRKFSPKRDDSNAIRDSFYPQEVIKSDTATFGQGDFPDAGTNTDSLQSLPLQGQESTASARTSLSRPSEELVSHERFYTAVETFDEQAEDWNKTRCANRVSLVRMPSSFTGISRLGADNG